MAHRISIAPWIAGAGLTLAACSSSAPLPAPGDTPVFPDRGGQIQPGTPGFPSDGNPGSSLSGLAKSLETPPPPLSGGTLLVLRDGRTAVASDPDRDMIFVADIKEKKLIASIPTKAGAQPGRAVQDNDGNVHVVLRESGEVVSLKAGAWSVLSRQQVCPAPRGIAFDGSRLWVACAGGELVQATAAPDRKQFMLDRDLRDVVATNGRLLVTQFRSAQVLTVSPETGEVLSRTTPPGSRSSQQAPRTKMQNPSEPMPLRSAEPSVAWRMRALSGGGAMVLHQEASNSELGTEEGGYGGGPCAAAVGAAVTTVSKDGSVTTSGHIMFSTLPIDLDVARDGRHIAIIMAGNDGRNNPGQPVLLTTPGNLNNNDCSGNGFSPMGGSAGSSGAGGDGGGMGGATDEPEALPAPDVISADFSNKQPVAVAFDGLGHVVVQSREPAVLMILGKAGTTNSEIVLSKVSKEDSGERVFHMGTNSGLACASCHPEGGDDGRVWKFERLGARRTQNLRGGIVNSAPFHWDGDMKDLGTLMTEVFNGRMQGPQVDGPHLKALAHFMDKIKAVPTAPVADNAAANRGRTLFNSSKVGCATCHTGASLSNNATVDVGTGHAVQVPSLKGLGARAPFMHTGCAKTLMDRFDPSCGGGDKHGVTSHLTQDQLQDLSAYMETL